MIPATEQYKEALQQRGIIPPATITIGKIDRADVDDKHGKGDASYIYFADNIPAGGFENHRDGAGWQLWRADVGRKLSLAEREAQRDRIAVAQRQRDADDEQRRAEARQRANVLWNASTPADAAHPYLAHKCIPANGLRLHKGALVLPLRDAGRTLHSLQFIDGDGSKRFLTGGRKHGCYYSIGKPCDRICVAKGYATAASIHEATGYAVAVAFGAGNLGAVAEAIKAKHPAATLILCADNDFRTAGNPGLTKATEAALAVGGLLAVPDFGADCPDGATDFNDMATHRGGDAVAAALAGATLPSASAPSPSTSATSISSAAPSGPPWPDAMAPEALHGIAGEFVHMVEPNTEADPAAILVQFLVAFGALVGRGPHVRVEGDEHHCNLFTLLVGATAKGRKGTSWGQVRRVCQRIPDWKPNVSGLSSGEGLKFNVRDPREETKRNKSGELVMEITDEGVSDKRLLVIESEFASVLRVAQRQGSTLSATVREAWDSGNLRTLTKNDPVTATGAHICIIGHITADELRAELTATDSANGFANRFLFVAVKRSKLLPFGGDDADEAEVQAFADRLYERAKLARTRHRIGMTAAGRTVWATVYPELSAGSEGLHGAVTARAEAQVIRLALVYALLDGSDEIDVPHLLAGLAIWQYCDATARHIFGSSLGDRTADEIMRRLKLAGDGGLTRTEIRDHFGRNLSGRKIGAALEILRINGRAEREIVRTDGRPCEIWRYAK